MGAVDPTHAPGAQLALHSEPPEAELGRSRAGGPEEVHTACWVRRRDYSANRSSMRAALRTRIVACRTATRWPEVAERRGRGRHTLSRMKGSSGSVARRDFLKSTGALACAWPGTVLFPGSAFDRARRVIRVWPGGARRGSACSCTGDSMHSSPASGRAHRLRRVDSQQREDPHRRIREARRPLQSDPVRCRGDGRARGRRRHALSRDHLEAPRRLRLWSIESHDRLHADADALRPRHDAHSAADACRRHRARCAVTLDHGFAPSRLRPRRHCGAAGASTIGRPPRRAVRANISTRQLDANC